MTQHRSGLLAAVLACALALSGCGGGGGDSSPNNPQPPVSGMLGITASNYQVVGQATVSSALFLNDTGGTLTGAEAGDARSRASRLVVQRAELGGVERRPVPCDARPRDGAVGRDPTGGDVRAVEERVDRVVHPSTRCKRCASFDRAEARETSRPRRTRATCAVST